MPKSADSVSSADHSPTTYPKNTPNPLTSAEKSATSSRNQDNPFALYVNFLEPHFPYTGPLNDYYDPDSIPESPSSWKTPRTLRPSCTNSWRSYTKPAKTGPLQPPLENCVANSSHHPDRRV